MAYCSNCGKEISGQAVACPNCGHPGPGARPTTGINIDFGPVVAAPYSDYGKRVGAFFIDFFIILAVLIVLVLGGAVSGLPGVVAVGLVFGIASIVYKPLMEGAKGQTLGKMAVGIKVVRAVDASPIGYPEAFLRWVIVAVGWWIGIFGLVDHLWPLWDPHKQTLHDKVAKTIVVTV